MEDKSDEQGEGGLAELKPIEYLRTINGYLSKGNKRSAYAVVQRATIIYPEDPFILSFYGFLQAALDRKYRSGVDNCAKAIALLKRKTAAGKETMYPLLYLNLGRAYLAASKKQNAIVAFTQGLQYDPEHATLKKELKQLGTRRKPPVSFLGRSNPINKALGKALHGKKK